MLLPPENTNIGLFTTSNCSTSPQSHLTHEMLFGYFDLSLNFDDDYFAAVLTASMLLPPENTSTGCLFRRQF